MQGSYHTLVESNKEFIMMMNTLESSHEAQKKEEEAKRVSELSVKRPSIAKRRSSILSTASSIVVNQLENFGTVLLYFRRYLREF